jgi:lambda repressor-like predicted transcriptional regulator
MLTDDQVLEIRTLGGTASLRELARRYNVSHVAIRNVLIGKRLTREERTPGARTPEEQIRIRFWAQVQKGSPIDCWLWQAAINSEGYGQFSFGGRLRGAHVVATLLSGCGPCEVVRHICNTPACVNPNHLLTGTTLDNVQHRVACGRSAHGEGNGRSKLTADQVKLIRQADLPIATLARQYGVDPKTIRSILTRKTWKHI